MSIQSSTGWGSPSATGTRKRRSTSSQSPSGGMSSVFSWNPNTSAGRQSADEWMQQQNDAHTQYMQDAGLTTDPELRKQAMSSIVAALRGGSGGGGGGGGGATGGGASTAGRQSTGGGGMTGGGQIPQRIDTSALREMATWKPNALPAPSAISAPVTAGPMPGQVTGRETAGQAPATVSGGTLAAAPTGTRTTTMGTLPRGVDVNAIVAALRDGNQGQVARVAPATPNTNIPSQYSTGGYSPNAAAMAAWKRPRTRGFALA